MQAVPDNWSIVLVGAWNRAIFGPKWLSAQLADGEAVTLEVNLDNPSAGLRVNVGGVRMVVSETRLEFTVSDASDEVLLRMEAYAVKILSTLTHTPITALGVNFRFEESPPRAGRLDMFKLPDADALSELGFEVGEQSVMRALRSDAPISVLNLKASLLDDAAKFRLDFNYHQPIAGGGALESVAFLEGNLMALKAHAEHVIAVAYADELPNQH